MNKTRMRRTLRDQCCFTKINSLPKTTETTKNLSSVRMAQWRVKLAIPQLVQQTHPAFFQMFKTSLAIPSLTSHPLFGWVRGTMSKFGPRGWCARADWPAATAFWGEHGPRSRLLPSPKVVYLPHLLSSLFSRAGNPNVWDLCSPSLKLDSS